jgi:hypothetical protein
MLRPSLRKIIKAWALSQRLTLDAMQDFSGGHASAGPDTEVLIDKGRSGTRAGHYRGGLS